MAGRGTDILLGGNAENMARESLRKAGKDADLLMSTEAGRVEWEQTLAKYKSQTEKEHDEVVGLGGLHIVGTERHDSRRIDNQLRGRAGRQGDPGSSRFYLSLQDDLLRIFGGERMQNLMLRLGMEEDVPIESNLITKRIKSAQEAVEVQNFEARKHLLEYDDVMNKQRTAVYSMRRALLEGQDQKDKVLEMTRGLVGQFIDMRAPEGTHPDKYDFTGLETDVQNQFGHKLAGTDFSGQTREEIEQTVYEQLMHRYQEKEEMISPDIMRQTERMIMLQVVDDQWKDHLLSMDHLKEGIGLRGYGQKDPLVEYKKESFVLFQDMMDRIEDESVRILYTFTFEMGRPALPFEPGNDDEEEEFDEEAERAELARQQQEREAAQRQVLDFTRKIERTKEKEMAQLNLAGGDGTASATKTITTGDKVGRNDPCPCGSGKKYKKCHGS